MRSKLQNIMLILFALFLLTSGCSSNSEQKELQLSQDYPDMWQNETFAQRFNEATSQKPTVVESAIELSEKYAKLSEEANLLKQQNQSLSSNNQQLHAQITSMEEKLRETQTELSEANEVLIEMRLELNNWKSDVLGFREEMRNAEKAQLQALLKILRALGGDSAIEMARSN